MAEQYSANLTDLQYISSQSTTTDRKLLQAAQKVKDDPQHFARFCKDLTATLGSKAFGYLEPRDLARDFRFFRDSPRKIFII
jgi:hypothetical protein